MIRRMLVVFAAMVFAGIPCTRAQEAVIAPADNLVVDGVPKIPASLVETAGRYGSYRSAIIADWHPTQREMLVATRFGDTPQLHLVKMPGGGAATTHVLSRFGDHRAVPSERRRLHFVHERHRRRGVVSAISL